MSKKTHKHQHYVPKCYLKAWHDETQPLGPKRTPYLWYFDRDGSNPRKKAPQNIFTENDIYTVAMPDGARDLRLEHGFGGLERKFSELRDHRLDGRQWPTADEMVCLLAFAAIARLRTPKFRDAQREQWGNMLEWMGEMKRGFEAATPAQKKEMAAMPRLGTEGPGITMEQVEKMRDHPIQMAAGPMLEASLNRFFEMEVAILCTSDRVGFVTGDQPCVWTDPEAYKRPQAYRGLGLSSKSIEVTMPISPTQCLLISHHAHMRGYIDLDRRQFDEINGRHIGACKDAFVARRNEVRPAWFVKHPLPEDAWENRVEAKAGEGSGASRKEQVSTDRTKA
jgi:hypothetical protein